MYIGIPNPNILMPLEKMTITIMAGKNKNKKITVLYNPEQYTQARSMGLSDKSAFSTATKQIQIAGGMQETLKFTLFFDSMSAGAEVGGTAVDKLAFGANSMLPSAAKAIDVRKYTDKIFNLMLMDSSIHNVPSLKLEWSSLQFTGVLSSCSQNFTRFNETGTPVRAQLECEFLRVVDLEKASALSPLESPDTTKYHMVTQTDSLWALSAKEYGQPEKWREIAAANGLANPRRLRSGERLVIPALIE